MDDTLTLDHDTARRRWPVRLILVGVVFALVLPGLVFCGILLGRITSVERARSREAAQAAATRGAEALDRELGYLSAALLALSTSPALDRGDLPALYNQAIAVASALGHPLVLSDLQGQQVLNTRTPLNQPLPPMAAIAALHQVIATGQPTVSDLVIGNSTRAPAIIIMRPVMRQGHVMYIIAMSVQPAAISSLLVKQNLPPGWVASVADGTNHLIARSVDAARYLGRPATADMVTHERGDHAMWVGTMQDGTAVLAASQRLRQAGWRVAVGVPLSVIEAPLRTTVALLAATGAVTLVIACLLAWTLAASVEAPLRRLARAGAALGQGLPVLGVRSAIAEVDAVSRALVRATQDLRARADALATERAQLAAVIETVPVGLVIAEAPSGRIVSGNSRVEAMLRHPLHHSGSVADYVEWQASHPDGSAVLAEEYPLALVLRGAPNAELRCIYHRGDGSDLWVQLAAAPIHAPDGTLAGGVVAILDIDEVVRAREAQARFAESLEVEVAQRTLELEDSNQRLRDEMAARSVAEEALRQSQKMEAVGQLTGGIAHDFNNLLTIIVGSLDLLRRRAVDARTGRLLDNALDGAGRAATLTARLLAFSRRQPLMPQPVDANHLVAGMSDLLHRTLGEGVQVETTLATALWQVHADPNQVENALLNLVVNARDAIVSAGRVGGGVVIETANATLDAVDLASDPDVAPGDYIRIAVADTGTGMPEDVVARVFEPFFTTKPQGQGTGLGLSQVHGFVKQSGGHVTIRTRVAPAADQGTTVAIYLPRLLGAAAQDKPIQPAPLAPPPLAPPPLAPQPLAPTPPAPALVVLLVEDDGGVRRYSAEALRDLGHTVLEADAAPAALRLIESRPDICLLLTDVILPGLDGTRLAEAARRIRPGLPVLFASGYTGAPGDGDSRLPNGACLLNKPFTLQILASRLREALDAAGHPA